MSDNTQRRWSGPVVAGVICAVLAVGYVFFMFRTGRSGERSSGTAPLRVIHLGSFSTAIDYAPLLVAQSKGWIQAELPGEQVEFTTFQTLPSINEAFAAGKLDVVFEAEVPAIVGRAAGIDICATGLEATLREGILVSSSSSANSIADLKGKRVAVLSGSAMHYGLVELLRSAGLDSRSVGLVNMVPPDAAAAFASHQVDGWAVWPPWPEQQVVNKTGRFLPNSIVEVQSVLVMRRAFVDRDGKEAQAIARAIERSKNWLQQNESEGVVLVARQLKLPEEVVRLAWPKHDWNASLTSNVLRDIENKAAFLFDQQMIQHSVTDSELVCSLEGR